MQQEIKWGKWHKAHHLGVDATLTSRRTKTQQGNCDLTYSRWGGFPDLPAFPKHTGKVCFLELHRQPAATGTPFIILKNKILIYQIILSSKTSLFYHKSIIHQLVSVAPKHYKYSLLCCLNCDIRKEIKPKDELDRDERKKNNILLCENIVHIDV